MNDVLLQIFEKYNQQLEVCNELIEVLKLEKEILAAKLENANLKNELEKEEAKEAAQSHSKKFEIENLNEEKENKFQSIKDEQEKMISELISNLDAQEQEKQFLKVEIKFKDQTIAVLKAKHAHDLEENNKSLDSTIYELAKEYESEIQELEETNKQLKSEVAVKNQCIEDLKEKHKIDLQKKKKTKK